MDTIGRGGIIPGMNPGDPALREFQTEGPESPVNVLLVAEGGIQCA